MAQKKRFYGEKALEDITKVMKNYAWLLDQLGVDNVTNAGRVIGTFRGNISELYDQNQALIQALECDNWKNAVRRAESLVAKDNSFDPQLTVDPGFTVGGK